MARSRRILHATDFSRASTPALKWAIAMAKANRARLTVVHVMAPPALGTGPDGRTPGSTALGVNDAMPICAATKNAAEADTSSDAEDIVVFISFLQVCVITN